MAYHTGMDSLADILQRYPLQQPDELLAIKQYIATEFGAESSVGLQGDQAVIITVRSASLANTLRLRVRALQAAAKTTKRLIFRIG